MSMTGSIERETFGHDKKGRLVTLFRLKNRRGMELSVMDRGCTIVSLQVPDAMGVSEDIVLGFDRLSDYEDSSFYFGSLIGRFANRIAKGNFVLDGTSYQLAQNAHAGEASSSLHGGNRGFDQALWFSEELAESERVGIRFKRVSEDDEEGYPGRLAVSVTYWLTQENCLRLEYVATTNKATPLNLTHHSYFNLDGHDSGPILGHRLTIAADQLTPVDSSLIPTGKFLDVAGTPFDFRRPREIGIGINRDDEQLRVAGGYDHNFVLSGKDGQLKFAAHVEGAKSGRTMKVYTTQPGLQFYSGNFLSHDLRGKSGARYGKRHGFCLETQHFPDSPNQPNFPSAILHPGQTYTHTTEWHFGHPI